MDPITIGLLAGGGMGLLQGQQNERKMAQDARLKAELARYSPWSDLATHISTQSNMQLPDSTASLFKGAAMGASMGNLFGGSPGAAGAGQTTAGGAYGTGMSQTMTPEMQKWQMMNQMQGGPGYTMIG